MAKATGPTLFDAFDEPPKQTASTVPFAIALMALGIVRGLGHKGLQSLVALLGENLGSLFSMSHGDIKSLLVCCKVTSANRISLAVSNSCEDLLRDGEESLRCLEAKGIKLITPSHLPERFLAIGNDSPKWLFVQGDETLLQEHPSVAVVGTRKPTDFGYRATNAICHVLSPYPVVLVSGLADGIDGEAHACSLSRGLKNVAFLGHGMNLVFPEQTSGIRSEIIRQGGAVVSEYMPDQTYQKHQFVERNRLQAALADIVIPVEAAASSGTAHTARFARKYERRIIGVKWAGANGLVDELSKEGDTVIDILTVAGQRQLDAIVQNLVNRFSCSQYPFTPLERQIAREMKGRAFTQDDVARLIDRVRQLGQESSNNG